MMRINPYLILAVIAITSGCAKENRRSTTIDVSEMITIDVNDKNKINLRELIEDIEFIPLRTPHDIILGEVQSLFLTDDKIIVVDSRHTNSILFFNRNGEFISRINDLGQGPKEYVNICHATLSYDKAEILVYDDKKSRLLSYDIAGNFKEDKPIDFQMSKMEFIDNGEIVCTTYGNKRLPSDCANDLLMQTDRSFKVKSSMLPNKYNSDQFSFVYLDMQKFGDDVYIHPVASDTIYVVKKDHLSAKYRLDLKGINGFANPDADIRNEQFIKITEQRASFLGSFVDNDDWLIFNIAAPNNEGQSILNNYIYDKFANKTYKIEYDWRDPTCIAYFNLPMGLTVHDDKFVSLIPSSQITTFKSNALLVAIPEFKDINAEDDPVVAIYTLKNRRIE